MNLSLKGRVTASFIIANTVVLALTFVVFYYLSSLNKQVEDITLKTNRVSLLTDEIRISAVSLLKYQRRILTKKPSQEQISKIINLCESFTAQLQNLDSLYEDADVKKIVGKMLSYVDSLKLLLEKGGLFERGAVGSTTVGDLADKILDSFSEFQDIQYFETVERNKEIKSIIRETKRQMMIVLIIGFLFTIILALVVPGKISLPFKKIRDAIRELQDCNFDVSIYYSENDEIGEIASEMNRMIHSLKTFEELRANRISVENRKFDALANLVKKPILVANASGDLIYLNNISYSLLQVQSEDVVGKAMKDALIPPSIIDAYNLAIKRRSKIENLEVQIPAKSHTEEEEKDKEKEKEKDKHEQDQSSESQEDSHDEEDQSTPEYAFEGYATVIPVRGKESSLDYYLMVLSVEVFA